MLLVASMHEDSVPPQSAGNFPVKRQMEVCMTC